MKISIIRISLLFSLLISSCNENPETTALDLLDSELSQWDMHLSYRLPADYNGEIPVDSAGKPLEPFGYNNNEGNVFSVSDANGSPVLRISGEIYGCLITKNEYENYSLKMKVKWGGKKWEPRMDKLLDSGILYHSQGEMGDGYWRTWMPGQEFQIMEGHMGDYWNFSTTGIDIRAYLPEGEMMNMVASEKQPFLSVGAGGDYPGFCLRSADFESDMGEWTDLELICFGDKSLHIVNGHVVMILQNSRILKNGQAEPLTKGKIQLQSEAAEVYFKDITLQNITSIPEQYTGFFQ